MRNLSCMPFMDATNATVSSSAIDGSQLVAASFMGVFSDAAAAGTLKIQVSNDFDNAGNMKVFVPTNWMDLPLATATVVAGASVMPPMPLNICYRWYRVVWTRSAGAGTFTVYMNAQSF